MENEYEENRIVQLMKAEKKEAILYVCPTDAKDEEYSIFWDDVRYWALVENRYVKHKGYDDDVMSVSTSVMPVTLIDYEYMDVGSCENQKVCLLDWENEQDVVKQSLKTDPNWRKAREMALRVKYKEDIERVVKFMRELRELKQRRKDNKIAGSK